MRLLTAHRLVCLASLCATSSLHAQQTPAIDALTWLAGCWEASLDRTVTEEQWMSPEGGIMLGMNRSTQSGQLVGFEFLMLDGRDTALVFVAHPSRQATTIFPATAVSDGRVEFANPAHDFPQRIGYERRANDSLLAWIEGPQDGALRRVEFAFARAPCPGT